MAGAGSGFGRAWTAVFLASVIALAAAQDGKSTDVEVPYLLRYLKARQSKGKLGFYFKAGAVPSDLPRPLSCGRI